MRRGVDRGPCFSYWRLSYRRKLIRTCWFTPVSLAVLAAIQLAGLFDPYDDAIRGFGVPWPVGIGWWAIGATAATALAQAAYTYGRWRREVPPALRAASRRELEGADLRVAFLSHAAKRK
jgi:hypothetical protein